METLKKIITWVITLIVLVAVIYWGHNYWTARQEKLQQQAAAGAGDTGPMPLPVAQCTIQDFTDALEFTGTTQAVNTVEIRARIEGYLQGIHFTDGALVEKGQLLFTIEPDTYKSRKLEADAKLQAAKTELHRAKLDFERIEKAVRSGAVSEQDLTSARAAYDTAKAQVAGFEATLVNAELDLSYTEIRSPIAGRIGRRLADIGNLVGAGERTILTTVRQIEPMYVFFNIGENLLEGDFLKRLQTASGFEPLTISVGLPNQDDYPFEGTITYLDNAVDNRTGTIYVRGELPNKSKQLLPGMFVLVRVPTEQKTDAVFVPEAAVLTDLGGKYMLTVGEGNVLQRKDVELGATVNGKRLVLKGLQGNETFIVGGFHLARPGMPITPIPSQKQ